MDHPLLDPAPRPRAGQILIEASSGNTAKALQVPAAMRGLRLRALTNRTKVAEVRDVLELLGVELEELPGLSECPDPTVPDDVFSTIEKMMTERPGEFYHTSQYTNLANVRTHHDTTGQEIAEGLPGAGQLSLGSANRGRGLLPGLIAFRPCHLSDSGGFGGLPVSAGGGGFRISAGTGGFLASTAGLGVGGLPAAMSALRGFQRRG